MISAISVLLGIAIAGGVTPSPRDTALGFTGEGQQDAAMWVNTLNPSWYPWYATEGNQHPPQALDANGVLRWFTNGTYPGRTQPSGFHEVTETAKLLNRQDGLGDSPSEDQGRVKDFLVSAFWHQVRTALFGHPLSGMSWYSPDGAALIQAEQPVIQDFLQRERAMQPFNPFYSTWEIGNEGNMTPAITPRQYADIFARYYRAIKYGPQGDPDAVLGTSQISNDLLLPGTETLTRQVFGQKIAHYDNLLYGGEAAIMGATLGSSFIWPVFSSWAFVVELGASAYVDVAYSRAKRDTRNCLIRRLKMTDDGVWNDQPTLPWFQTFLSALPDDVAPDYIGLHVYPLLFRNLNGYGLDSALRSVDRQVRGMQLAWVDRFAATADAQRIHALAQADPAVDLTREIVQTTQLGPRSVPAVWVTEFGNINAPGSGYDFTNQDAADLVAGLWDHFSSNPNIHRWFLFEPRRFDATLADVGIVNPMTRMVKDTAYDTPFDCDHFSTIGSYVYQRLSGSPCGTPSVPARVFLATDNFGWRSTAPLGQPAWLRPTTSLHAVVAGGSGYRVVSRKVPASLFQQVTTYGRLGLDVFVPAAQQNPWWMGEAQVSLNAPQLGLWDRWIGRQSFDSADRGNWNHVSIVIPSDVIQALQGHADSVEIDVALNGNGAFGLDGLRLEKALPSRFPSVRPTRRILDYEDLGDWTSTQATLRLDTSVAQSGRYSLQAKSTGWSQIESAEFDRNAIQPRHKFLVSAFRRPSGGNSGWAGTLSAQLTCRNQGINNAWLGQVDLSTLPVDQWSSVSFPLPTALATTAPGGACHVDWSLNGNGTTNEYALDRMGFSSTRTWEDEASVVLTPTGGAIGFPDTAWHPGQWRTFTSLDSLWIAIPAKSGTSDSLQIQIQDSLGRSIYGTWEAQTTDGGWSRSDSLSASDSGMVRSFRLQTTPLQIRLHLVLEQDPSQCTTDSSGLSVCTPIPVGTAQVLWDYVLPGEDDDL